MYKKSADWKFMANMNAVSVGCKSGKRISFVTILQFNTNKNRQESIDQRFKDSRSTISQLV